MCINSGRPKAFNVLLQAHRTIGPTTAGFGQKTIHIAMGRRPEKALVFAVKLGRALVTNAQRGGCGVKVIRQHQPLGFMEPEAFLKLER